MYKYVGPKNLLENIKIREEGFLINSGLDIENWILHSNQKVNDNQEIIATFIIDEELNLRISDRHSEHVVCAAGKDVLSAGEITFRIVNKQVKNISKVSNQSTGYCPEPSSWSYVSKALEKLNIDYPDYFTEAFIFRICKNCHNINIDKR